MDYARIGGFDRKSINKVPTPQSRPIPSRVAEMAPNAGGGYGFILDDFGRTYRFLIIGTENGSFYVKEKAFTKDALKAVERALAADPIKVIDMAVAILRDGRAFKTDPALFVLALGASYGLSKNFHKIGVKDSDAAVRKYALDAAMGVIRQSTMLFHFMKFVQEMRGWGSGLRKAFARWYVDMPEDKLALQMVKYKNRDGVTHRDMLRLAHPKWPNVRDARDAEYPRAAILQYAARPKDSGFGIEEFRQTLLAQTNNVRATSALKMIAAAEELLHITSTDKASIRRAVNLIRDHDLTHEMVSSELKGSAEIWAALAQNMPVTATLRNLGKMTAVGAIAPLSQTEAVIIERLTNPEQIGRSKTHPMQFLIALRQYGKGAGEKGSLVWTPTARIKAALDDAFPLSFGNVERTGKRIAVACDVSQSMWLSGYATVVGTDGWLSAEIAAAMALIQVKVDPNAIMLTFHTQARIDQNINRKTTVAEMADYLRKVPHGGTDTGAPFARLLQDRIDVDAVITYTDNETWAGKHHVVDLHKRYQQQVGHPVRFFNAATSAHGTTDVDPGNPNMFEMCGFDGAGPRIISEYISGGF